MYWVGYARTYFSITWLIAATAVSVSSLYIASGAASRITLKPEPSGRRRACRNTPTALPPVSMLGTNLLVSAWVAKKGTKIPADSEGSGSAGIPTWPPLRTSLMILRIPSLVEAATRLPNCTRCSRNRSSTALSFGGR
ncbi:hypothetical protein D9M73_178680 [compost metagenome]